MAQEVFDSPGSYTFTVPSGITEVEVECWGGDGGDGDGDDNTDGGTAGNGGYAMDTLSVSPGDDLYLTVAEDGKDAGGYRGGEGGSGDGNGGEGGYSNDNVGAGGGGGASSVRYPSNTANDRVVIGGGGGGGGAQPDAGDGGDSETDGQDHNGPYSFAGGGGAGSGGTGGAAGDGDADSGTSTSGGDGAIAEFDGPGGAGGGGYGGGGGGGQSTNAGGGGGGGGNLGATTQSDSSKTFNDGRVVLTYVEQPNAPQNFKVDTVRLNGADLSWTQGSGGDPDQYLIYRDGSLIASTSSTSYTDSGLNQRTQHSWYVVAENTSGQSGGSNTDTATTGGYPSNAQATDAGPDSVDVTWTEPAGSWTEVRIYRTDIAAPSFPDDYSEVSVQASGASWTDSGLTNGREYTYRLTVAYADGVSDPSPETTTTTDLPAPTLDSLDAGTPQEITIPYTLEDDSTDGDVLIERSADGGSTWSKIATVTDLSATAYTDTGLLDGQEYTYRLTRRTDHAETTSATVSAITSLPAPTNLTAPTIDDTSVGYAWDATHNQGQTRVEYRRAGEGDDWTTYETVDHETEAATVDGLLTGEQYEGRVVAQTDFAETEDE